jgi:hypothetical protein
MRKLALFAVTTTALLACTLPKLPFLSGTSSSHSSETRTVATSETHTVNGHPVDKDGNREDVDDDDDDRPKAKASHKPHSAGAEFGATCRNNSDCASNTCYVGSGEIGYCTKICDDFGDCPMSGWECTHEGVGNAPQKICQQEKE